MNNIIKLDKRHIEQLVNIDFESNHQGDKKRQVKKTEIRKELKNRFKVKHEIFFGYKKNNELIAYVTLKPFFPGHKHCEVYWIAVKKKSQGNRIGTKLMKFIENYAKKKGFRKVFLYTGKNMKLTRKFYEKIGYKFINEFKNYYGYSTGNTTAVLYGKII